MIQSGLFQSILEIRGVYWAVSALTYAGRMRSGSDGGYPMLLAAVPRWFLAGCGNDNDIAPQFWCGLPASQSSQSPEAMMLGAAVLFFLLAIAAAFFGFTGIAGFSANIAWILLAIFVVLFVLSLLVRLVRGGGHHTSL